jgi:hypothetical protein
MSLRNLNPQIARWMLQAITRLIGTYAILQGIVIIIGGRERWSGKSFAVALTVPGAPATWGVVLMLCGLLTLLGTFVRVRLAGPRVALVGTMGIAAWCLFFAASLLLTALADHRASTTGIGTYLLFAILAAILAVAYLHSED